jgi:glycosyltransferase involved in cell wall biosynthesis
MRIRRRPRAVLLGRLTTMPYGGVMWQTLHYLLGLERMGFEAYYVEAHAVAPRHFMGSRGEDGAAAASAFLDRLLRRFGLGERWAFHALDSDGRCYGLSRTRLFELYASAEVLLNLHGGTRPQPEHVAARRLVCVATDPVQLEVELNQRVKSTIRFFEDHHAVFSFGENYGRPDCGLPVVEGFPILPTRQPVVLDLWQDGATPQREVCTTIANWRQQRCLRFAGETYQWSKDLEFEKVLDLPRRTRQPLELALSRCPEEDRRRLRAHGWRLRDALALSADPDVYRDYVQSSRGEFTVAKDQNVRLRSGWFSDRSATYLAAGRPVVTQDTGFGSVLPEGEGLFAFSTVEQAAAALDAIHADYARHSRAAREIARRHFAHDVVLGDLLERAGVELPARPRRRADGERERVLLVAHRFPPDAMGGVERYTEKVAGELAAAGLRVEVVARSPRAGAPLRREVERLPSGVVVHRLVGGRIRRPRFLLERAGLERLFREVLTELEPDVVHVNHLLDLAPATPAMAREHGAAVVLGLHDYYAACSRVVLRGPGGEPCDGPEGGLRCARACFASEQDAAPRWTLRTAYFRRLLDTAHRLVCPSAFVAGAFARLGVDAGRLRVVPNGVWVERAGWTSESWPTPHERGRLALAFLGAVLPHKGLRRLLEALARARLDAVDLTVFGPVGDQDFARDLCRSAAEVEGLRFRLYGEYQPEEIPALLQDVDCVVVPSQWPETFCLVAREALARGIPVAVSRLGALPDAVEHGRNGFVFDHDRPEQLAELLARLVREPDLVRDLRAGARATPIPTLSDHVRELRGVYREALDERDRSGAQPTAALAELMALEQSLEELGFGAPRAGVEHAALPVPIRRRHPQPALRREA